MLGVAILRLLLSGYINANFKLCFQEVRKAVLIMEVDILVIVIIVSFTLRFDGCETAQ